MTSNRLRIYPPQSSTAAWEVLCDDIQFEFQLQYAATATLTILTGWETYYDESDANSPIQLNAYVTYEEDGVFIFRGNIFSITRTIQDGVPGIIVDCLDKLHILKHTYCSDANGSYIMRDQTPLQVLTTQRMYQGEQYTGLDYRYTYYPKYDSEAWLDEASCTDFVIIDAMADATTDIAELVVGAAAAGGYPAIPPAGFFSVGTEWCQYNGLQYNQAAAAGEEWTMLNVRREMLGSTHAAHAGDAAAHSRLSKRIACEGTVLIEGVCAAADTNPTPLPDRHYQMNYEDGSFVFGVDALELRTGDHYEYIQATYSVYNEDGGSALVLSDVVETLLASTVANGGPGLSGSAVSVTISPDPVMARYVIEDPTTVDDAIRRLLFELGLNKGSDNDLIGYFYNSADNKIHLDTLAQEATPDRYYHGERARTEEVIIDDVASAVIAWYSDGGGFNLCNGARFWHMELTTDASPKVYHKLGTVDGLWTVGVLQPSHHNATWSMGKCLITDNDANTGFAMAISADPTTSGDVMFYAWFPGANDWTPETWYMNKVSITFEFTGTVSAAMEVTIKHIPDISYSVGVEPTGTLTPISPSLTQIFAVNDDAVEGSSYYPAAINQKTITLQASGLCIPTKGLCVYCKILPSVTEWADYFSFKILDIYVEGVQQKSEIVKLASAYDNTKTNLLVAPLSYAKIVDSNTPQHRVQVLDLGTATREVALNLAWLQLLQTLALSQSRVYTIDSTALETAGIPIVGETLEMSDGFAGLCDNIRYQVGAGGTRQLEVRLIDYNTTLFGMSL